MLEADKVQTSLGPTNNPLAATSIPRKFRLPRDLLPGCGCAARARGLQVKVAGGTAGH